MLSLCEVVLGLRVSNEPYPLAPVRQSQGMGHKGFPEENMMGRTHLRSRKSEKPRSSLCVNAYESADGKAPMDCEKSRVRKQARSFRYCEEAQAYLAPKYGRGLRLLRLYSSQWPLFRCWALILTSPRCLLSVSVLPPFHPLKPVFKLRHQPHP